MAVSHFIVWTLLPIIVMNKGIAGGQEILQMYHRQNRCILHRMKTLMIGIQERLVNSNMVALIEGTTGTSRTINLIVGV